MKQVSLKNQTFYRTIGGAWEDTILEPGPSFVGGGRFNPPGNFGALYFSSDKEVALLEWLRERTLEEAGEYVTYSFKISLVRGVDLGSEKSFSIPLWRSGASNESQKYGQKLFLEGMEGILYLSSKIGKCKNLVVFPANVLKNNSIKVLRKEPAFSLKRPPGGASDAVTSIVPSGGL